MSSGWVVGAERGKGGLGKGGGEEVAKERLLGVVVEEPRTRARGM